MRRAANALCGGIAALCVACSADPTQQAPSAAQLAAAPLQQQPQRLEAIRAALLHAGQNRFQLASLQVEREWDETLLDDFQAEIRLRNLLVRGEVRVTQSLSVPWLPDLDRQIGQPGWTPELSLDGRRLFNALGPGQHAPGSLVPVRVVGRFADLAPGFELYDLEAPDRVAAPIQREARGHATAGAR